MESNEQSKDQPPSSLFTRLINFLYDKFGSRLLKNRKELITIFEQAQESGLMDKEARDTMQRVLQVSDLRVSDIMIPSAQMIVVDEDLPLEECLDVLVESAHSRFPVMDAEKSVVKGILLAKDMLRFFDREDDDSFDIHDMLREAKFVPESKRLNVLLSDFRRNKNHMAIVINEYGAIAGLVTIEDVLEQIVGEIDDEYDNEEEDESMIRPAADGGHIIKAILPINEFNEYFSTEMFDERCDTMGGLISQRLGRVPQMGDEFSVDGFEFEVIHADSRRIHLIRVQSQAS